MSATLPLDSLPTFAEFTRETCLVCMGRGWVPVTARNKFTDARTTVQCPCLRCHGSGRTHNN